MKKLLINSIKDIADYMYTEVVERGCSISFIGLYPDASFVLKLLLTYDEIFPHDIDIHSTLLDSYNKEYLVTLDTSFNVWCEKAYRPNGYIHEQNVLIADDCNDEILDAVSDYCIVSYAFDWMDECESDDCNGDCEYCDCCGKEDDAEDTEETVSEYSGESTHISRTKDGKLAGFQKTWSNTDEDGVSYYSSFSHYGSNEEYVKKIARDFGINV